MDTLRLLTGSGRDGSTASSLLDAAEHFGLCGRGIRLEIEDLQQLPPASILHWNFNHFVVFEGLRKGGAQIADPSFGRCFVPMSRVSTSFTGVALVFEPREIFAADSNHESTALGLARQVFKGSRDWIRVAVVSLALLLGGLGLPFLTAQAVDRVVPAGDRSLLVVLSLGLVALVMFHFVCSIVRGHLLVYLRARLESQMTLGFLYHLLDLPYAFFHSRPAGEILTLLKANSTAREILTSSTISALLDGSLVCVYFALLVMISPAMGLIVFLFGGSHVAIHWLSRMRQRDFTAQTLRVQAESQSYQLEMAYGMQTLKAMGCERRAGQRWTDIFVDGLNVKSARARLQVGIDSALSTLRLAAPLAVLMFGTERVLSGQLSLGNMLALSAVAAGILGPLSNLITNVAQLQLLSSHVSRIEEALESTPEQPADRPCPIHSVEGAVTVERVSFRYSSTGPLVLNQVRSL